jgi:hypothetical protein
MLSLFNRKKALHRVAPVENNSERIMAILSYSGEPNYIFCDDVRTRTLG